MVKKKKETTTDADAGDITTETIVTNAVTADVVVEAMQKEQAEKEIKAEKMRLKKERLAKESNEMGGGILIPAITKHDIAELKANEADKVSKLDEQMEDITPIVKVIATQTNEREIVVSFKFKTNKLEEEFVVEVVNYVLLAAAPEVANILIREIGVQDRLRAATRQ